MTVKNTLCSSMKSLMHCLSMQIDFNASRESKKYIVDDETTSCSSHNFQDMKKKTIQKETRLDRDSNLKKRQ